MTVPASGTQRIIQNKPRRVRLELRDAEVVIGGLYLNEGQSLAPYLGSRKGGWVNVINADWEAEGDVSNHAVIQADHILLASSIDGDVPVHGVTTQPAPRDVAITLEDRTVLRGTLHLAEKQRLSDFLSSCGKFIPLLAATRSPNWTAIGDVVVNAACVRVIRDARLFAPGTMDISAEALPDLRSSGAHPVVRDVVHRENATIEIVSEGHRPERRSAINTRAAAVITGMPPLAVREEGDDELSTEQRALAAWLGRHWLVQVATGAQLLPPDPRALPASPSLEEVWRALAERNALGVGELAAQVAAGFHLPVANLDVVQPEALREVPERVARKLNALALRTDGHVLHVAVSDPSSVDIEQQLGFVTKQKLAFEIAPPAELRTALEWHYTER